MFLSTTSRNGRGFEVFWESNDGGNSSLGCKENFWWCKEERMGLDYEKQAMGSLFILEMDLATKQASLAPRVIKMQEMRPRSPRLYIFRLASRGHLNQVQQSLYALVLAKMDLEASMIDTFALEMLLALVLDDGFFEHA
ncbi:hypothetical protein Tco_0126520 [Tanacetum coccineum]